MIDDDEGGCEDESVSDAGTDAGADADARERVWTMVGLVVVRARERECRGAARRMQAMTLPTRQW